MMVPLLEDTLTAKEKLYNATHKKCRCTIERTIGVLKSRFRCLCRKTGGGLQYQEEIACKIILSCIVLHNYCRDRNLDYNIDPDISESMRKEAQISINRKYVENQRDEVQLRLGQIARRSIINSF